MGIRLSDHFTYKKLLRFVLPSIAMMVFISVYGVVDGFFVSNFAGKTSFAAINLVMPFVMLLGGIGFMVGTGGTALVSKVLGEGDREKANRYFSMMVFLTLLLGVLLTAVGIAAMEPVARFLGATDAMIADSVLYGRIVVGFTTAFMLQNVFQSFLIAAEKPKLGLLATIAAGLTNILLDALFFGGFGWGVAGAAIATGISQCVGGLLPLFYFLRPNDSLLRLVRTKPELAPLVKACTNGSSELLTNISMSFVSMLYNYQLITIAGTDEVAAFGVIMYVAFFFEAIFIGYSMGTAPIVSYNYGARRDDELRSIFRKSLTVIAGAGLFLTTSAYFAASVLADIFVGYDETLATLTVRGFRFFSFSFLLNGFCMYGSAFFTALNNGFISSVISLLQSVVFQIIAVIVLPLWLGTDGIWLSVSIAKLLAFFVTVSFWISCRKEYHYA